MWGEEENSVALSRIERLLDPTDGLVLVPGSGAGRLAWDLGQRRRVVALESNPLVALLSHALMRGKARHSVEFPRAPLGIDDVAVHHLVKAPVGHGQLEVVLADLLNPPFSSGSFDAVVTHWLIDVIDCPFTQLVNTINRLLKPGGVWVNSGSVAFETAQPTHNLMAEEVEELVLSGGFMIEIREQEDIPYLRSPHSRQQRTERVHSWRAIKTAETSWAPWNHLPAWLVSGNQPIPQLPAFATQSASVRIHAWLMSMIDGKRSANDIAAELARQGLMPQTEAEAAIRNFLTVMWEEMQRSG